MINIILGCGMKLFRGGSISDVQLISQVKYYLLENISNSITITNNMSNTKEYVSALFKAVELVTGQPLTPIVRQEVVSRF